MIIKNLRMAINKKPFMFLWLLLLITMAVTPILCNPVHLFLLWFVFLLIYRTPWKKGSSFFIKKMWIYAVISIFLILFYIFAGISLVKVGYSFSTIVFFFPILGLFCLDKYLNYYQIKVLFNAAVFIIALNVIDSIRISIMYPEILYQQLGEGLEMIGESNVNVGGAMFVNMVLFYINLLMFALLNVKNRVEKIYYLVCLSISVVFIVGFSLKASAVILGTVSILAQYIAHKGKKSLISISITSLVLLLIAILFLDQIIYFIIDVVGSDRLASRLLLFVKDSNGMSSGDDSSLVARFELWITSLKTWLSSPISFIFGIGDRNPHEYSSFAASGIGYHSDFTDIFARYGLVGALIFFKTLSSLYKYVIYSYGKFFKFEILAFFLLVLLMGLTKRFVSAEPAVIIFVLFPLCLKYLSFSKKDSNLY